MTFVLGKRMFLRVNVDVCDMISDFNTDHMLGFGPASYSLKGLAYFTVGYLFESPIKISIRGTSATHK